MEYAANFNNAFDIDYFLKYYTIELSYLPWIHEKLLMYVLYFACMGIHSFIHPIPILCTLAAFATLLRMSESYCLQAYFK